MQNLFTTQFIKENCGCYKNEEGKLEKVYKENNKSCFNEDICEVTIEEILNSNISIKDKFWFICKKAATKEENQWIAIGVAEIVVEIYENKYPNNNKAPREAIQAAKDYLNNTGITIEELRNKRNAAAYAVNATAAAYAAAYAANADHAADHAAYAVNAVNAVNAAAYAAYADDYADYAANAVNAAAYAVNKKDFNKLLLDFLINFCKNSK